jgi:hypothetical protein
MPRIRGFINKPQRVDHRADNLWDIEDIVRLLEKKEAR